jgi:hypothetical protein
MQRSTERILTMHAGSLARPSDLREMVLAKSHGQPYNASALARMRSWCSQAYGASGVCHCYAGVFVAS